MLRRTSGLALIALGSILGCGESLYEAFDFDRETVGVFQAKKIEEPVRTSTTVRLRVLAWNIKYGAGRIPFWFDCWGDRVQMSAEEVESNMAGLYALINEYDPDILMAEEIEMNSRRSAYYNMVQGILDHTKLNYGTYMQTWGSRYIAAEGLGRMNLGNAVFSKYPITKAERIRQADRTDQDALTAAFYIHRAIGRAEIAVSTATTVAALVVHTAAYDNDGTKQKHIKQIQELVEAETFPFVLGGDFNEVPPTAVRLKDFPDERSTAVCSEDFSQPPYTPKIMQSFYDKLHPWVTLAQYGATEDEQQRYYSHTVLGPDDRDESGNPGNWSRTLDYLFIDSDSRWGLGTTDVIQFAGQRVGGIDGVGPVIKSNVLKLSDHAPVVGTWEVH